MLIIILISGIYFYNSIMKKRNVEHMTTLGSVYKVNVSEGDPDFYKVDLSRSTYFNIELDFLKKLPIVDSDTINNVIDFEQENKKWNGTKISLFKIIKSMQEDLEKCGSIVDITKDDMQNLKDRKDFIKMIPYLRREILDKINYESIRCFVKNYEPNNLINIIKLNKTFPDLFDTYNVIFINNYLYKITHLGVIKYKIDTNIETDDNSNLLNASLETTILNDINNHINSNNQIIILKGEPYKLIKNKIHHIITKEVFEIQIPDKLFKIKPDIIDDEIIDDELVLDNNLDFDNELIRDESLSVDIEEEKTKVENLTKQKVFMEETIKQISSDVKLLKGKIDEILARSESNREEISMLNSQYLGAKRSLDDYISKEENIKNQIKESKSKIKSNESFSNIIDDEVTHDEIDYNNQIKITSDITDDVEINIKTLFYIDNKLFFVFRNHLYPNKGIGLRINYFIKSNDLYIRSVNNFYYYTNNKISTRLLFICSSNLYFYIENSVISDLLYFDDDFNFKSTHTMNQTINCNQYQSVLSQLKLSNKISNEMKVNVLKSLKCKF